MRRKIVAVWVILSIMFGFMVIVDKSVDFLPTASGATLYVNTTGSGGAYTSIQDAIDNATSGNTVFIFNGTYEENFRIEKTINLTGEDMNSTIIYEDHGGDIIHLDADWVNISNLAIDRHIYSASGAGIGIHYSNNCSVENVSINNTRNGIKIYKRKGWFWI